MKIESVAASQSALTGSWRFAAPVLLLSMVATKHSITAAQSLGTF